MRNNKADVYYDAKGKIILAYPKGQVAEVDGAERKGFGYIVTPLKKGTARAKGNNFEIQVAKTFSTWLYGDDRVMRRTPLSGGWGSGKLGDITMDPALAQDLKLVPPKVYVECKNYADLLGHSFFRWQCSGDAGLIGGWLSDTAMKAKGMPWFLVLKGNGTDPWLMTPLCPTSPFEPIEVAHKGVNYFMAPLVSLKAAFDFHRKSILG